MNTARYEVRTDTGTAHLHPGRTTYCVWDTQADQVWVNPSTDSRCGQVSQQWAQDMADFINSAPVTIWEDNSGSVYLGRDNATWALGPVTADMHGKAASHAYSWCAGTWEPNEHDGQQAATREGLTQIATWAPDADMHIELDANAAPLAGAGGARYLGIELP